MPRDLLKDLPQIVAHNWERRCASWKELVASGNIPKFSVDTSTLPELEGFPAAISRAEGRRESFFRHWNDLIALIMRHERCSLGYLENIKELLDYALIKTDAAYWCDMPFVNAFSPAEGLYEFDRKLCDLFLRCEYDWMCLHMDPPPR